MFFLFYSLFWMYIGEATNISWSIDLSCVIWYHSTAASFFSNWIQFGLICWFWSLSSRILVDRAIWISRVTPRSVVFKRLTSWKAIRLEIVDHNINLLLVISLVLIILIILRGINFCYIPSFSLLTWWCFLA